MGNVPRLEMFARSRAPGWDVWGNEVRNSIELQVPEQNGVRGDAERRWRRCSIAS